MPKRPVLLCVLDGWGLSEETRGNAIRTAKTPVFDDLWARWPHTTLDASGEAVGLRPGLMGNSEVGHLNIGAGRVVWQDIARIDRSIDDGSFFENPALLSAFARAAGGGRVHLVGLVSDGGVHSDEAHYLALVRMAARQGLSGDALLFHAITDGRDTSPTGGAGYVRRLEAVMTEEGVGRIATLCGRYWAMDRDNRWDRTRKAYEAYVEAKGRRAEDAAAFLESRYAADETDEFLEPTILPAGADHPLADGDAVVVFNYRADRVRQITRALALDAFDGFPRPNRPRLHVVTFMPYHAEFDLPTAFDKVRIARGMGEWAAHHRLTQLRVAETEKYAHVTYFFNGGREEPFEGEERILVPSPQDVATYDARPEMSAAEVARQTAEAIRKGHLDLVVLNFANPDMVGHTGVFDAAVQAVETVDACLGEVVRAVLDLGGRGIVTADHGNAETMLDAGGNTHTAHTTNPVPCIVFGIDAATRLAAGGKLASLAPTLCRLLEIDPPPEMTGDPLF